MNIDQMYALIPFRKLLIKLSAISFLLPVNNSIRTNLKEYYKIVKVCPSCKKEYGKDVESCDGGTGGVKHPLASGSEDGQW